MMNFWRRKFIPITYSRPRTARNDLATGNHNIRRYPLDETADETQELQELLEEVGTVFSVPDLEYPRFEQALMFVLNSFEGTEHFRSSKQNQASRPRNLVVPPWSSTLALDPLSVIGRLQQLKRTLLEERNKGQNILCSWIERCGFDPQELVRSGIISSPGLLPHNLQGDIHPMLHFRHWTNVELEVYEFLRPSLLLATKLLTKAAHSRFWLAMFLGKRIRTKNEATNDYRERVEACLSYTESDYKLIREILDCIGWQGNISYHFDYPRVSPADGQDACPGAYAWTCLAHPHEMGNPVWSRNRRIPIVIAHDFLIIILHRIKIQQHDSSEMLRFNAFFAIVIVHEIVHALDFYLRSYDAARGARSSSALKEPLFLDHPEVEVGSSWEIETFKGVVHPINGDVGCQYGLCYKLWPALYEQSGNIRVEKQFAIPMWYIYQIQREDFWQRDRLLIETDLELPRDGVPVSYGGSLTIPLNFCVSLETAALPGIHTPVNTFSSNWQGARCLKEATMLKDTTQTGLDHEASLQKEKSFAKTGTEAGHLEASLNNYELVKDLTEDRENQIAVYRCNLGNLVVCKILYTSGSPGYNILGEELPIEVVAHRRMIPHRRIVSFVGVERTYSCELGSRAAYLLMLGYCNGGDLDHLAEHGRMRKQSLPEAFVWHVLKQTLEALSQTVLQRVEHQDVHPGNIFLHFDKKLERQYPDVKLGDFGMCQILTETQPSPSYEEVIKELAYYLLNKITQPVDQCGGSIDLPQYSSLTIDLLEKISSERVTLQLLMKDLYPLIPSFIQLASTAQLPDWMVEYFQHLQDI